MLLLITLAADGLPDNSLRVEVVVRSIDVATRRLPAHLAVNVLDFAHHLFVDR